MSGRSEAAKGSSTPIPLLDFSRGNGPLRDEYLTAIGQVIDSGRFLFGPDVKSLEEELAQLTGAKHAIACASGSDALLLALMAVDVTAGDEVIVPSFTFFATASAAWRLGAKPVFVDIDPETYCLDPQRLEAAITPATKAIIPVHLFGRCAEMDVVNDIAQRHDLAVIEDAAQSVGARYRGRGAGSMSDLGAFSFYPTKNLGGFGDGGLITTSDDDLLARVRLLAAHGMQPRYYHQVVGINSRLDTIQAAILRVKLRHLARWTSLRQANADRYFELFEHAGCSRWLGLPARPPEQEHVWNQFTVRVPQDLRNPLREHLQRCGVGTEIYYPVPLHLQECFRALGYTKGSLPETERAAREVLSLPIYPELTESEQQAVVVHIADFFSQARAAA